MKNPIEIKSPKSLIREVLEVVYNGEEHGTNFTIVRLLLNDDSEVYGIRYNRNNLNPNNPELGYPTIRGHETWLILPDLVSMLPILNELPELE